MLFAMFIGAMNYANNLALGLAFLLGGLGLTAMHHCHRNLAGVRVRSAGAEPVFAGESATFRIALENAATLARPELEIRNEHSFVAPQRVDPGHRVVMELNVPASIRGFLRLEQFEVATQHPVRLISRVDVSEHGSALHRLSAPGTAEDKNPLRSKRTPEARKMQRAVMRNSQVYALFTLATRHAESPGRRTRRTGRYK